MSLDAVLHSALKSEWDKWRTQDFAGSKGGSEKLLFSHCFAQKLHEIERIWTPPQGVHVPSTQFTSANGGRYYYDSLFATNYDLRLKMYKYLRTGLCHLKSILTSSLAVVQIYLYKSGSKEKSPLWSSYCFSGCSFFVDFYSVKQDIPCFCKDKISKYAGFAYIFHWGFKHWFVHQ